MKLNASLIRFHLSFNPLYLPSWPHVKNFILTCYLRMQVQAFDTSQHKQSLKKKCSLKVSYTELSQKSFANKNSQSKITRQTNKSQHKWESGKNERQCTVWKKKIFINHGSDKGYGYNSKKIFKKILKWAIRTWKGA